MPKLKVGDIDIYYEIHGEGSQTLVMIRGLGADLCASHYLTGQVIAHDGGWDSIVA